MKLSRLISRLSPTAAAVAVLTYAVQAAHAQSISVPDQGKLLLTGGVMEVDGAGGGGLVPWAMITGYGTRESVGANAHETFVTTPDFRLNSAGAAGGFLSFVKLSINRAELTHSPMCT